MIDKINAQMLKVFDRRYFIVRKFDQYDVFSWFKFSVQSITGDFFSTPAITFSIKTVDGFNVKNKAGVFLTKAALIDEESDPEVVEQIRHWIEEASHKEVEKYIEESFTKLKDEYIKMVSGCITRMFEEVSERCDNGSDA